MLLLKSRAWAGAGVSTALPTLNPTPGLYSKEEEKKKEGDEEDNETTLTMATKTTTTKEAEEQSLVRYWR